MPDWRGEIRARLARTAHLEIAPAQPKSRKTFIAAMALACAAHLGVLAYAAWIAPPPRAETPTRIATLLLGHVGDKGDFEADGYVQARIRAR